jgi:sec-independent protein translocase protein TatA
MGPIGGQEMFLIALLALLLFGPKKLPELGRMLGKGLTEFRRAKNELKSTFESHMHELDREARLSELKESVSTDYPSSTNAHSSSDYSYSYDEQGHTDYTHNDVPQESAAATETHEPQPAEPVAGTVPRSKTAPVSDPVTAPEENHPA